MPRRTVAHLGTMWKKELNAMLCVTLPQPAALQCAASRTPMPNMRPMEVSAGATPGRLATLTA